MTKSNVPRMTLLHHLVEQAEAKQKDSLAFVDDLLDLLQKASRYVDHAVFALLSLDRFCGDEAHILYYIIAVLYL